MRSCGLHACADFSFHPRCSAGRPARHQAAAATAAQPLAAVSPAELTELAVGVLSRGLLSSPPVRDAQASLRSLFHSLPLLRNDQRAALSRCVLATVVHQATLRHLQAFCADRDARARSLPDAAALLALLLLHGDALQPPGPGGAAAPLSGLLPLPGCVRPPALLAALAAASPAAVPWPAPPAERLAARRSLPLWLASSLVSQYGAGQSDALAAALNAPGPVTLRANAGCAALSHRGDPAEAAEALARRLRDVAGIDALAGGLLATPGAVLLPGGRPPAGLWSLPDWAEGQFEPQDEGSQIAAAACCAQPGERVLDLCAGRGGKALALAAAMRGRGLLAAHDTHAGRLAALASRAARAARGSPPISSPGDGAAAAPPGLRLVAVGDPAALAALAPFDVVLIDAPCSSTGALRRRPSGRWEEAEAGAGAGGAGAGGAAPPPLRWPPTQRSLLAAAAALLRRPGGRLVYATCSLLAAENEDVSDWADDDEGGLLKLEPWPFEAGEAGGTPGGGCGGGDGRPPRAHTRALLPHVHGTDGFYIARWKAR